MNFISKTPATMHTLEGVRCRPCDALKRRALRALSVTLSAALSLTSACRASTQTSTDVTLAQLRARASGANATDAARRDYALAELFATGGDGAHALQTLNAQRAHNDPRVLFALAEVAQMHGDFAGARDGYIAAINSVRAGSTDPLGVAVAEASADWLLEQRGNAEGFREAYAPLLRQVAQDPGRLGPRVSFELLESGLRWAREKGDQPLQQELQRAANCVTHWRVAGAFGPHPMIAFDREFAAEGPGPLAHEYALGPGRQTQTVYDVYARGCAANLGSGRTQDGVFVAAADYVLERDQVVQFHVETPNVFRVLLDGHELARVDPRTRATGTGTEFAAQLRAGRHTLRVKVASRYFSPLLITSARDLQGRAVGSFEVASASAHESPPIAVDLPADPVATDPFSRYVLHRVAVARRDPVAARELLRPLIADTAPALTQLATATVSLSDPFLPAQVARDRARRAFERAQRLDANAYYPYMGLARLAAADDRADAALDLLRTAHARFADNPEIAADFAERLLERNWEGEASVIVNRFATMLGPDVCWPQRMQLSLAQRHGDGATERTLSSALARCDALSEASAFTALRQRRWGDAGGEYARLFADASDARSLRRTVADLARRAGRLAEASAAYDRILRDNPEDVGLRTDMADLRLILSDERAAREFLAHELSLSPSNMAELFRTHALLARRDVLEPWRLDGRTVFRAYKQHADRYEDGQVLVLDYTVRRVFEDGSAIELTHNIVDLRTQEAVDEHATFTPPEGSTLTLLRTLKADGRVLEPEAIARLDAVAYPDVRPGDAIEYEFIRVFQANEVTAGGFRGERFYFRGTDTPYDRTELVVVLPKSMEPRLQVSPRGDAPVVVRREHGGSLVELRWGVRESRRREQEPMSIAFREYTPSIDFGVERTYERYMDALRDRLAEQSPLDPAAERLAAQITANAHSREQKLQRLYRWVLANIDQEGAGTPFDSAPAMLAVRAGHRARVLMYLLQLSGVPVTLALVRPGGADQTESDLADDDTFVSMVLRVTTEAGVRWVSASDRDAPLGYLAPALDGQPVILVADGAARETIPRAPEGTHTRVAEVHLTLNADGLGQAECNERLRGSWAVSWRDSLRRIDGANLNREFESYIGRQVTAASLTRLTIDNRDNPERDLVMRYAFEAPSSASLQEDGSLAFEGVFPAELAAIYAPRPTRTVDLYHPETVDATLDLHVTLPAGAIVDLPTNSDVSAPGITWSIHFERVADGFKMLRHVVVPGGRVSVADYPRFAESVRALDRAEQQRVTIRLH
jgi:tetratricopeptide (TPR) repeat protein